MKMELSDVANTLVSQSSLFECTLEVAWKDWMHPIIVEQFSFEEVNEYIQSKIKLGERFARGLEEEEKK